MAVDSDSLHALEGLMNEFFHFSTSNQRKRSIEEQLERFGQQKGAWKHCIYFFENTANEYVLMYCLSVLENLINKMWLGVDVTEKADIRMSLYQILLAKHRTVPAFIQKKLLKVIVDIGRLDWPMFYPNFFTNIINLTNTSNDEETRTMGMNALRIVSEELALPREDLPHHRKLELRRLLLQQVSNILHVITDALEKEWIKYSESQNKSLHSSLNTSPLSIASFADSQTDGTNLGSLFDPRESDQLGFLSNRMPPLLPEKSHKLATEALECLCHLFSWIPLSSNISTRLLNVLFSYTTYGISPSLINRAMKNNVLSQNQSLGTLSMTCINELMAKNCIPVNFEDYLLRVFRFTFHFLKQLTDSANPKSDLEMLDEGYLEKFTEFLRLFVSLHFHRIESNPSFPLLEFLELLFKFTFNQPTFDGYYSCLDIWELFFDYLGNKVSGKDKDTRSRILMPYKDGLNVLVKLIMTQIQFRCNQSRIEELDNEVVDDTGHTEWQQYVIENLEIICKICSFFPRETLSVLYPILQETSTVYLEIGRLVTPVHQDLYSPPSVFSNSPRHVPERQFTATPTEHEYSRVHCSLRDLATVLQAFGRLSEFFIGENFHLENEAMSLVEKFLTIVVFGSRIKLFDLKPKMPSVLYADVLEVHSHALAVLQPFTHWLFQLYTEFQNAGNSQAKLVEIMQAYLNAIVPMLDPEVPDKLVLPASHTLLSAVNTVRAAFLLQSPIIDKLYSDVAGGSCSRLATESQKLIYRALSNLLLLSWPNTPDVEQRWDARQQNHMSFINNLFREFLSISGKLDMLRGNRPNQLQAKGIIMNNLNILEDMVTAVDGEIVKTRQLCHSSLNPYIELSLELFPIFLDLPDVTESLIAFFLASFRGLRSQMGSEKTLRMIHVFIKAFTPAVLEQTILHENSAGVRVVEKFIKILEIVINEVSSTFKVFTSEIIQLAIYKIYPIVAQRSSPDIKESLFKLLFHILSTKNRYFFPAPVLASYLTKDGVGVLNHKEDFIAIMQAFGQSFLQSDICVFKHNLQALDTLNQKQRLYEKVYKLLSQENILFQFITVLVQALIQKSHDLLQDEIYSTTWNMARVDFEGFHSKFLPQFLSNVEGVTPDQKNALYKNFKQESDQPTYTQSMQNFVNDLRYFHLCNLSLPEGTVKF